MKLSKTLAKLFLYTVMACNSKATKILTKNKSDLAEYCNSTYFQVPQLDEFTLDKIIVVHRHGDRAPLILRDSEWKEEDCFACIFTKSENKIEDCKVVKCGAGDLTVKGSKQLKTLGKHIKTTYKALLAKTGSKILGIKLRATKINRTHSSIFSVINGIEPNNVVKSVHVPDDDSLLYPSSCEAFTSATQSNLRDYFFNVSEEKRVYAEEDADDYLTHLCNRVPINCDNHDCNDDLIAHYLSSTDKKWLDQSKLFGENIKLTRILFGRFAGELLDMLSDPAKMHIISAHDDSLSAILVGISTQVHKRPSYASAIFIEKWSNGTDKYIRFIYNNKEKITMIDPDVNIPLHKFEAYLKSLKLENDELEELCMTR